MAAIDPKQTLGYAIIMLDPQGRVVTWNEGARRLKGYAEAEIVGQPMERFYSPEEVAAGKSRKSGRIRGLFVDRRYFLKNRTVAAAFPAMREAN